MSENQNPKSIVDLVENKVKFLTELKRLHMSQNVKIDKADINRGNSPKPFNLWKGILLLPSKTLGKYFTDNYQKQIQRWFYLACSLGDVIGIPDDLTFVKASLQLLEEYDFQFSEASKPYQISLNKRITSNWGQSTIQSEMETAKERHFGQNNSKKQKKVLNENNEPKTSSIETTSQPQQTNPTEDEGVLVDLPTKPEEEGESLDENKQLEPQDLLADMRDRLVINFKNGAKEFLELIDDDAVDEEDTSQETNNSEVKDKKNKKKKAALLSPKIRQKNGIVNYEYLKTPSMV